MTHRRGWWVVLLLGTVACLSCSLMGRQGRGHRAPAHYLAITADGRGELVPCG